MNDITVVELEYNVNLKPLLSRGSDLASGFDVKAINIKQIWNSQNRKLEKEETERINNTFSEKEVFFLQPASRILLGTGLKFGLPDNMHCLVHSRSSLPLKQGLIVGNSPGIIDSDYTGEVGIILINTTDLPVIIKRGQRIAQLVFEEKSRFSLIKVEEINKNSIRGDKGFGSSGI